MPRAAQINRLGAPAWPSTEIALAVQIGGSECAWRWEADYGTRRA